jgi:hypothetical protein
MLGVTRCRLAFNLITNLEKADQRDVIAEKFRRRRAVRLLRALRRRRRSRSCYPQSRGLQRFASGRYRHVQRVIRLPHGPDALLPTHVL